MYPPTQLPMDIDALSGICGCISIACWVVVFSPQMIENFRRGSAEGLSVVFIVVWLLGDVFNIVGAVLQHVLPTMIILAVYYAMADVVLLLQYFYYEGFTLRDHQAKKQASIDEANGATERTALLSANGNGNGHSRPRNSDAHRRRPSIQSAVRERLLSVDGTHLSPATPLLAPESGATSATQQPATAPLPRSTLQSALYNTFTIVLVCAAGVFGWWLSRQHGRRHSVDEAQPLRVNVAGQVFGYISAVLYLGSRVPQLLLNHRRKSTEGISMLFFLFACIGNLTYVLSIVAYAPVCERPRRCGDGEGRTVYLRYIAVNLSWLLGSFGTLILDAGVFVQYFMYRKDEEVEDEGSGDERPLLRRD